jgi:hypothetical protein
MAYNLGNLWRRLVLPKRIDNWSLTSVQQRLMKTGGRLIKHAFSNTYLNAAAATYREVEFPKATGRVKDPKSPCLRVRRRLSGKGNTDASTQAAAFQGESR